MLLQVKYCTLRSFHLDKKNHQNIYIYALYWDVREATSCSKYECWLRHRNYNLVHSVGVKIAKNFKKSDTRTTLYQCPNDILHCTFHMWLF